MGEALALGDRIGVLLERERELAAIRSVLRSAAAGRGSALLVRGPAGIGKSQLLAQARVEAREAGMLVLDASGALLEREFPFGVARQLLIYAVADANTSSIMFAGAGTAAESLLAPEAVPSVAPDASYARLTALFWALSNLSTSGPVAVLVDDLQWVDELSLRFIDFLSRRLDDMPVAVISARRSGEDPASAGERVLPELESSAALSAIEPDTLSVEAVRELSQLYFDEPIEPVFAEACRERTAGNPFFVTELLRECEAGGIRPDADGAARVRALALPVVGRVVLARLSRLGADRAAMARAVALLGDGAELADVAELAGLSRGVATNAVKALSDAGILRNDQRLAFVHPLMSDAINGDLPASVLAERHSHAAHVLAANRRGPERIAAHLLQSRSAGDQWAVEQLRSAAGAALARGAPDAAVTLLRRASMEPPSPDSRAVVLFELGSAEARALEPEAMAHLGEAFDLLPPGPERAVVGLETVSWLGMAGRTAQAYPVLAEAQIGLGVADRELALALEAIDMNLRYLDPSVARFPAERIAELARLRGETLSERAVLGCVAAWRCAAAAPVTEVVELLERVISAGAWQFERCRIRSGRCASFRCCAGRGGSLVGSG